MPAADRWRLGKHPLSTEMQSRKPRVLFRMHLSAISRCQPCSTCWTAPSLPCPTNTSTHATRLWCLVAKTRSWIWVTHIVRRQSRCRFGRHSALLLLQMTLAYPFVLHMSESLACFDLCWKFRCKKSVSAWRSRGLPPEARLENQ